MNKNNGAPSIAAVPVIGQPVTVTSWAIPVTAGLVCNCRIPHGEPGTPLALIAGKSVTCPHCQTVYVAFYDPRTGQVQVGMHKGEPPAAN
jgi:hypothetical protein